jgi:hypothetical protein
MSKGGIFLVKEDEKLVELQEALYDSEAILQELLAKYPNLLAGEQINVVEPRRWLLIAREAGLPSTPDGANRWAVDHLFIDQDGIPTIVEVKRSSDTRIRREVVGQMLDYAANAVLYWPIERIVALFEQRCERETLDPETTLVEFIGPESDSTKFWGQVKDNLRAGKVRMVFVADIIPPELRRVVEFLNYQMEPAEVLAIEIKQYMGEGFKALVPRLVGQTIEAQDKKQSTTQSYRQWDESSFMQVLAERQGSDAVSVAKRILSWSQEHDCHLWWGKGKQDGSFVVHYHYAQDPELTQYLFAVYTYGNVEVHFQYMKDKPPFDTDEKREELQAKLNQITGINIPLERIALRPSFPLSVLIDKGNLADFFKAFEWVIEEAKEHYETEKT